MRIIRFFFIALLASLIITPDALTQAENNDMKRCIAKNSEKPNPRLYCYQMITKSRGLGIRPSLWAKCQHASEAACDADVRCEWHENVEHPSSSFCSRK